MERGDVGAGQSARNGRVGVRGGFGDLGERFTAALPRVRALGFDEPFIRTWLMYLAFSEAAFAERTLRDHQLLLVR